MSITKVRLWLPLIGVSIALLLLIKFYPVLLIKIVEWQRSFNQLISGYLNQIEQTPTQAGIGLVGISFLYGLFHAVGPGHGKFVIAGYLSTNPLHLKNSIRLTLLSSLMQGIIAVIMTSIVIVVLTLSSAHFRLTQLWMERASFLLIIMLGCYWIIKYTQHLYRQYHQQKSVITTPHFSIKQATPIKTSSVLITNNRHQHHDNCGCGHQHILTADDVAQAQDWKSQLMIILSIGARPCSGAIFVLFLAYMIDLYWWGVLATMAMAVGTGFALSCFALLVLFTRERAVKLGRWYVSPLFSKYLSNAIKVIFGVLLVTLGIALLYGTTLPVSGGSAIFGG